MKDLPKRSDSIYKEIEEFKDYELTYCIAYEMAIRNNEVKKIFEKMKEIRKNMENKNLTEKHLEFKNLITQLKKFGVVYTSGLENDDEARNDNKSFTISYTNEYGQKVKIYSKNAYVFNQRCSKKYIDKDDVYDNCEIVIDGVNIENYYIIKPEFLYKYKEADLLYHEGFADMAKEKENFSSYTKFIDMGLSRPKLEFEETLYTKTNLNLPKKELMAYMEKLKNDYDKDNSILKTPMELLAIQHTCNKELSKQQKWADMFFIYDYFANSSDKKSATKIGKIKEEFTRYYGYKIENINSPKKYKIVRYEAYQIGKKKGIYKNKRVSPFYGNTTIKDYLKEIRAYIDDLKYKELI